MGHMRRYDTRMPAPTPKETWIAQFVAELTINLRPGYPRKHADRIAHMQWATDQHLPPREAAKLWHESNQ